MDYDTPVHAAAKLAELAKLLKENGQLPLDAQGHPLLCISIQNFGMPQYDGAGAPLNFDWSFFNSLDSVDVNTDDDLGGTPDWPHFESNNKYYPDVRLQPWMHEGRAKAKVWMHDFVAEYHRLNVDINSSYHDQLPDWSRFHLDHESGIAGTGTGNWPFLLQAMVSEDDSLIATFIIGIPLAERRSCGMIVGRRPL